ncbi:ATP-dependent DNA ligase [Paraburkholderia fungorum]|uniref:ATP-dependent DNA ligase n=1 Tax=Paraburkholderia fungorum TaxID=134537 RepID=UPI0038B8A389
MSIPTGFKPNLAATLTKPELIKFPVYCSPKIDGIRCVVFDGVAYSRSLKPIPNTFVQDWFHSYRMDVNLLDGELVVGSATDPNCMQNSMAVMRKGGEPDFTFNAFDLVGHGDFEWRYRTVACAAGGTGRLRVVPQNTAHGPNELDHLEAAYLQQGYEGMMIRRPDSLYKFGRSTEREGGLVKVKRFTDAEAEVIGFEEEMKNENTSKTNALGNTERSSVASGLVGKDTLGALRCRSAEGIEFNIGTGFTADLRRTLWDNRESLTGQFVKYKHFQHGVKDAPRHPVFLGFRHKDDMS